MPEKIESLWENERVVTKQIPGECSIPGLSNAPFTLSVSKINMQRRNQTESLHTLANTALRVVKSAPSLKFHLNTI